ncbi:hypothetical protein A3Q56_07478 [Intoshia linei]|uniref:Uncharacterized protein n=1 Tax=Intoshia linei TaxID=1819745 RepID=A0A177ATV3_9BILA|nr:hypothetical protein A3Q56_07478 [Intoshia linei]
MLGIYCGDVNVDVDVQRNSRKFSECSRITSVKLGLGIKLTLHNSGQPVPYCKRVFCDAWHVQDSFQPPIRSLAKLTYIPKSIEYVIGLANNAKGYYVTDPLTPILSKWCTTVLALYQPSDVIMTKNDLWRCKYPWPQVSADLIRKGKKTKNIDVLVSSIIIDLQASINRALSEPLVLISIVFITYCVLTHGVAVSFIYDLTLSRRLTKLSYELIESKLANGQIVNLIDTLKNLMACDLQPNSNTREWLKVTNVTRLNMETESEVTEV